MREATAAACTTRACSTFSSCGSEACVTLSSCTPFTAGRRATARRASEVNERDSR